MTAIAAGKVPVRPGRRYPLGATPAPDGTNFAVSSGVADGLLLCLFDDTGAETRVALPEYDAGVWHGFVEGVGAGQAYGYRATGPRLSRPHPASSRALAAIRSRCTSRQLIAACDMAAQG